MNNPALVLITIDGLRARALGAYGNASYETPSLDQFASQSLVFDRFLVETTCIESAFDSLCTGHHALSATSTADPHLLAALREQGYVIRMVTDEPLVAQRKHTSMFDEVTLVEMDSNQPADDIFDTAIGKTLQAAADVLGEWSTEYEQPRMLWIHMKGLTASWDAPPELAASQLDDDDPELSVSTVSPKGQLTDEQQASDEAFLASCRYAAQVMVLDRCFGGLLGLVEELYPETPPTLMLAGLRGFALGEHGRLGLGGPAYRELLHAPLVVRGAKVSVLQRTASLVQTSDLPSMIQQLATEKPLTPPRRLVAVGLADNSHSYETNDWSLVSRSGATPIDELFVQPDDPWQANNVATRCYDELQQFDALRKTISKRATSGEDWAKLELLSRER